MNQQLSEAQSQYRDILRFVRRRVASREAAEDLTQEVFANAASALEQSASGAPPSAAWLYTVARRRIIDEARRHRISTVPLDAVPEPEATSGEYAAEVRQALEGAVRSLPHGQRRVVLLRLIAGQSFSEISRQVGSTEAACRMRFMRGLEQIRNELEKGGLRP